MLGWLVGGCAAIALSLAHAAAPQVGAGAGHGIALKADGAVVAWGDNSAGQLGLGSRVLSSQPVQVSGLPPAKSASAGVGHVLVLAQDGTVWSWGRNTFGQLGDGTRISRTTPVQVQGLANVIQVAAGGSHSLALKADGTVWAWGQNTLGAIGDNTTVNRSSPVQIQGLGPVTSIAAGLAHSLALQDDGKVFAWGDNSLSQIDGSTREPYPFPKGVGGMGIISAIAASGNTSYAVAPNGWVYWWGAMANNRARSTAGVARIVDLTNIVAVSSGASASLHTLFVASSGLVYSYYDGNQSAAVLMGQAPSTFVPVAGLSTGAIGAAAGGDYIDTGLQFAPAGGWFSTVLLSDGTISSWGLNPLGQLGSGSDQPSSAPVQVSGIGNVVAVASGNAFTLAVTASGAVWVWGDNVYGELADGTALGSTVPTPIPGTSGVSMIASGYGFNVALKTDGSALAWGDNTLGQVGNGLRYAKQSAPATVVGLTGITAVAAGMTHAIALGSDGTIWSWGDNSTGQLGRPTTSNGIAGANVGLIAAQKSDFVNGRAIAAGNGFSLALKGDGTVWIWGADLTGQTGCASFQPPCNVDPTVPRQVATLRNVVQIAAGADFAMALESDGSVFTFGSNINGQLGNGVILPATQNPPAKVKGLLPAAQIAAGGRHALAVLSDGSIWSWGWNDRGQLGNGSTVDSPIPATLGLNLQVSGVGAGYESSYAIVKGGPILAWGDNAYGEMGDGSYVMHPSPVAVVRESGAGNLSTNDWFLIPDPTAPAAVAASLVPPFTIQSAATGNDQAKTVTTSIKFLTADAGTSGAVFVTAKIPPGTLPVLAGTPTSSAMRFAQNVAAQAATADAGSYVLVQLTPSGWQTVANLQLVPYATGSLGSALASPTILAGIDTTQIPGAQFCVGYGADAPTMLAKHTIRSAYSVPNGPAGISCIPASATIVPQTGIWWNPAEAGRGYTIEQQGTNLFMAAYLYDASGRSTWYGAGPAAMNGSTFNAPMTYFANGQTLTGFYKIPTQGPSPGNISITFTDPAHGTLTWPGGTMPIQRYEFVPNGLSLPPTSAQPQSGWWWYPSEGGRGYSIEVQGNSAFIASYMYDGNGNPVWYASGQSTLVNNVYQGNWTSFSGGQTLTGSYHPPTGNASAGALSIQFSSPTTGSLVLPDGRIIPIQRYSF